MSMKPEEGTYLKPSQPILLHVIICLLKPLITRIPSLRNELNLNLQLTYCSLRHLHRFCLEGQENMCHGAEEHPGHTQYPQCRSQCRVDALRYRIMEQIEVLRYLRCVPRLIRIHTQTIWMEDKE